MITRPHMRPIPHPLRWAVVWFVAVIIAYGVSLYSLERDRHQECVHFRTEEAPAAFDSFGRFLGERSGLSEEEITAALEVFHRDLEEDLPVSEC